MKYVSFDGVIQLCLKVIRIGCLALKAHSRIVYKFPQPVLASNVEEIANV